jgi:hypothetical protein
MAASSDQIERQIGAVRDSMESRIVELRERGRRQARLAKRTALIAAGVGAAAIGIFVVYRLTRPASRAERMRRLLPAGLAGLPIDLRQAGRRAGQRLRRGLPPVRLYIGERQVGEAPSRSRWEGIVIRAAQAGGTALAGALVSRLTAVLADTLRGRQRQ